MRDAKLPTFIEEARMLPAARNQLASLLRPAFIFPTSKLPLVCDETRSLHSDNDGSRNSEQ